MIKVGYCLFLIIILLNISGCEKKKDNKNLDNSFFNTDVEVFSTFHTFVDNRDIAFTFNVSYYDGYMIDEFNLLELGVNFERLYGRLESGKYRIVKRVYLGNIGIEHYISKEFVMKEEGE